MGARRDLRHLRALATPARASRMAREPCCRRGATSEPCCSSPRASGGPPVGGASRRRAGGGASASSGGEEPAAIEVEGEGRRRAAGRGGGGEARWGGSPSSQTPYLIGAPVFFPVQTTGAGGYRTQGWTPHPCRVRHGQEPWKGQRTGSGQGSATRAERRAAAGGPRRRSLGGVCSWVCSWVRTWLSCAGFVVGSYSRALARWGLTGYDGRGRG